MASIGRGLMAVFYIIFGVIWVTSTLSIPSPIGILFTLAGIVVILLGLYSLFRKPAYRNPWNIPEDPARNLPDSDIGPAEYDGGSNGFCPYCGSPLQEGFRFCGVCGRRLRWVRGPACSRESLS